MNFKAYVAEFIGTLALIFVGVGAIAVNHMSGGGSGLLGVAFAHGLTLVVMISATAAVSGGHLNPAVTVGALVAKKIDIVNAAGYIFSQCLGAVAGVCLLKLSIDGEVLSAVNMGTPALAAGVSTCQGFIMESVLTAFLVFVVFGTAIDKRAPKVGGLFIGLTVALDILVGGPLTGAAMNPARYFGPALLGGGLSELWLYWAGPITGGIIAALVYHHILEEKQKGDHS